MEGRAPTQSDKSQVMSIMRTVLERCKKEKTSNCLQVPLEDYYERVSFYTAMSKLFIYHVVDNNPYNKDGFDDNDHIMLMECINICIAEEISMNINDLYKQFLQHRKSLTDIQNTTDLNTFESRIHSFGYIYKKNLKGQPLILIEDPKLKFCRYNYLYEIKKLREKKCKIYYLDEKYILRPPFTNVGNKKKCEGLIFFHMISADGYENGIYVSPEGSESVENIFKKWMLDIVLYTIKPGSVIVMENNSIHGSISKNSITRYHSKKCMLQWLRENNIPCDPDMKKPILYKLIEKCTVNNKDYDIDRVFKLHGHHVLRLPNNFPSLNPTKFLWDHINNQSHLRTLPRKNVEFVKDILLNYIIQIDNTMWTNFFYSTHTIENRIYEIDSLTEDLLENNCELDANNFYEYSANFNIKDYFEDTT